MFDKQYRFTGTHAEKVNALTAIFDEAAKAKLFDRNLDVYINAPIIGFLHKRKGVKNTNSEIADQNIFPEQMRDNAELLKYIFRLILILDAENEPNEELRMDKAFKTFGDDESDIALFDAYVLGGVEVLYEKLIEGSNDPTEYVNRMYDFVEEFNDRFNIGKSNQDILDLCYQIQSKN
jgi:hypothetical protein